VEAGRTDRTLAIRHTLRIERKRVRIDGPQDSVWRAETLIDGEHGSGVPSKPHCMCGPFEGRLFSLDSSHKTTNPQHGAAARCSKTTVLMIREMSLHIPADSDDDVNYRISLNSTQVNCMIMLQRPSAEETVPRALIVFGNLHGMSQWLSLNVFCRAR